MSSKHDLSELYQLQGLSLNEKVERTKVRLKQWVEHYGLDKVYVSFSGGKDSTVLLDIARKMYPDIKAVYVDTTLEFPEIRQFVKTFDNVDILKPNMNFRQVIEKYGYPMISKEVSETVYGARRYVKNVLTAKEENENLDRQTDRQTDKQTYAYRLDRLLGQGKYAESARGGVRQQVS